MFSKLKEKMKNLWKRTSKKTGDVTLYDIEESIPQQTEMVTNKTEILNKIDLKAVGDPIVMSNVGSKTLLVVNDIPTTLKLLELDFNFIKTEYHKDILNTYKVVICTGRHANLMAYKYLLNNHVDKALVDIVLSDSIIRMDDTFIEFNGFDVAEEIRKRNSESEIGIYTSVELNSPLDIMHKYLSAFKRLTRTNVIDKYININLSDRTSQLNSML
jgi:hypothetical protein